MAEDRRVRRTRRRLKDALMELIAERELDGITIDELTARADVARSTFYSHYRSKEDLLFAGFEEWLGSLTAGSHDRHGAAAPPGAPPMRFSLPLLRHATTRPRLGRSIMGGGGPSRVRRRFTALLTDLIRAELATTAGLPAAPTAPDASAGRGAAGPSAAAAERHRDAAAHALAGAFLGVAEWCLTTRAATAEEADAAFQALAAGLVDRGPEAPRRPHPDGGLPPDAPRAPGARAADGRHAPHPGLVRPLARPRGRRHGRRGRRGEAVAPPAAGARAVRARDATGSGQSRP